MKPKYGKGLFISIGVAILVLLVYTFFNYERVVPYEEAMQYVTFTEEKDDKIIISLNLSKGTVYTYNDNYFPDFEKGDNIYVMFKMSLFDRWFNREIEGFKTLTVKKVNGNTPDMWYIEDITEPNKVKTALNDRIIQGEK